jgi:transposase-like protein
VIVVAVRWYLRYGLSYRDVEELLLERGMEVDHMGRSSTCSSHVAGTPQRHCGSSSGR